jgi:hypothetical protein
MQKRNLLHFAVYRDKLLIWRIQMETLETMSKEELLKVLKYREERIKELEKEISLYQKIINELKQKYQEQVR